MYVATYIYVITSHMYLRVAYVMHEDLSMSYVLKPVRIHIA